MLHDLIKIEGGKQSILMTDALPKVRDRLNQLRRSSRGSKAVFKIVEAEEGSEKYRRAPVMNFCPSGDAGTASHRRRVARAKKIKKKNRR